MRILLSNDDGYFAPGHRARSPKRSPPLGEVTVVAPERDRSGASNSLTLDRPLAVRRAANGFLFVNGTPTDCVHLAVTGLLDRAARHRRLRHQPRRQHGRRHDLLRHRRRRDRGLSARHSVDRGLARRQGRRALRHRGRVARELVERFAQRAARRSRCCSTSTCPTSRTRRSRGMRGHAARQAPQGRSRW